MTYGEKPEAGTWRIGIQSPRKGSGFPAVLAVKDIAVTTSGDYERYYEINGKKYCHIINPETGMPVQGMASVTIIADSAAEADVAATSVFVLGPERGLKFAVDRRVEALIIYEDANGSLKSVQTDGFDAYVVSSD